MSFRTQQLPSLLVGNEIKKKEHFNDFLVVQNNVPDNIDDLLEDMKAKKVTNSFLA